MNHVNSIALLFIFVLFCGLKSMNEEKDRNHDTKKVAQLILARSLDKKKAIISPRTYEVIVAADTGFNVEKIPTKPRELSPRLLEVIEQLKREGSEVESTFTKGELPVNSPVHEQRNTDSEHDQ